MQPMTPTNREPDPATIPGLTWRLCKEFGFPSAVAMGMIIVFGYVGMTAVQKGIIPLVDVVSANLRTQTQQLTEQTTLMKTIAIDSKDTQEFRIATAELHRSQMTLLESINQGQIRLETQNQQLIIELRTMGDGIRALLSTPKNHLMPPPQNDGGD